MSCSTYSPLLSLLPEVAYFKRRMVSFFNSKTISLDFQFIIRRQPVSVSRDFSYKLKGNIVQNRVAFTFNSSIHIIFPCKPNHFSLHLVLFDKPIHFSKYSV